MSDVRTSKNRLKKVSLVEGYTEKVEKAKGLVFTNYQGLTHQQLESLKKAVKNLEAEYVATKNSLILRALKNKIDTAKEKGSFTQPTATLFLYNDIIAPLKHLTKMLKDFKLPIIKFGILDGKMMTDQEIIKISTLPPLPILRAQLLGQMQTPISGFHRALNWNLQQLVLTLNAIREKKV